jgi:hypothetical protein
MAVKSAGVELGVVSSHFLVKKDVGQGSKSKKGKYDGCQVAETSAQL